MGTPAAMARVAGNWALQAVAGSSPVRLGFLTGSSGRLAEFEATDDYLTPEQARGAAEQGDDPVPGTTASVPTPSS
jgi:NADH dehydrogenase